MYLLGVWAQSKTLDTKYTSSLLEEVGSLSNGMACAYSLFQMHVPAGPAPEDSFQLEHFVRDTLEPLAVRFHELKAVIDNLLRSPEKKLRRAASDPVQPDEALAAASSSAQEAESVSESQELAEQAQDSQQLHEESQR
ncbi:unnamed protein product [Prorocentrum cordatum]|uniref:Uncharacterized protein n=1 Tax=Prorocentrum cordatum TaxID=2364126 RepID=A0ABN9TH57_9DINO|nr:unnamed protein product [Polarella glacialis]